jgi:NADH:ubiquinone reductase (H+-translocating)
MALPQVVIIGGGFGGLHVAKGLGGARVEVTVVDRHNYHLFQPLLYQVATAGLSPGEIASPIRSILRKAPNVHVRLGEVTRIDLASRQVLLADGALPYDYLVLAAGVSHSYFGHDEWEVFAPGLKTLDDALEMRRRILLAFEAAEREPDAAARAALLTFVVVGAGPTGVELAGAIAEIARHTLVDDFRNFDPTRAVVMLLEAGPRVLPAFPSELSVRAERSLRRLGVEVRCGARVTRITAEGIELGEERLPTRTALWAAGVTPSPLARTLGSPLDRVGRVKVAPDLSVPGHPEVFVIGDLAAAVDAAGRPLPGLAPVAIQQGKAVAVNVKRAVTGKPRLPFRYCDRGTMATIGRAAGVADIRGLHLGGLLGWLAWLLVHIVFLIGFRNRLLVMLQWAGSYLTYSRGARLITGGTRTAPPPPPGLGPSH